jgi:hypothetical protein
MPAFAGMTDDGALLLAREPRAQERPPVEREEMAPKRAHLANAAEKRKIIRSLQ